MQRTLASWGWFQTGALWGSTVATYSLALAVYVHLHMGLCHVLAAVAGIPGCEMRIIPYFLSRLRFVFWSWRLTRSS